MMLHIPKIYFIRSGFRIRVVLILMGSLDLDEPVRFPFTNSSVVKRQSINLEFANRMGSMSCFDVKGRISAWNA